MIEYTKEELEFKIKQTENRLQQAIAKGSDKNIIDYLKSHVSYLKSILVK